MELQNKEVLCARLPDSVYKKLNLVDTVISEFFYKEMQDLLPNNMMNTWPLTQHDSPPLLFSLVCFTPPLLEFIKSIFDLIQESTESP
jgi:hypothetical protein